jgi:hypothetical protein
VELRNSDEEAEDRNHYTIDMSRCNQGLLFVMFLVHKLPTADESLYYIWGLWLWYKKKALGRLSVYAAVMLGSLRQAGVRAVQSGTFAELRAVLQGLPSLQRSTYHKNVRAVLVHHRKICMYSVFVLCALLSHSRRID